MIPNPNGLSLFIVLMKSWCYKKKLIQMTLFSVMKFKHDADNGYGSDA